MNTTAMNQMGGDDSGDGSELSDLDARVSAIEAKLGMNSPADDSAAPTMKPATPMSGKGGPMKFFGS